MNSELLTLFVIFSTLPNMCRSRRYDNFTLFNVVPKEVDHLKFLQNLEKQKYIDMIFLTKPLKLYHDVHFMVHPSDAELFRERANHFKMRAERMLDDVQDAFDNQTIKRYFHLKLESYTWEFYHTWEDIKEWLTDLALKFPKEVEIFTIGTSVEGREISMLVIKKGDPVNKVIVEGGIHGNEWISAEFVTYLAHQLIHSNSTDRLTRLSRSFIWYLIPIVNPDGYNFSQKDRLYKKNKSNYGNGNGVNLNRNFNYSFGTHAASFDPNDELFCGPEPFSEPETIALKKVIQQNTKNLKFYFAIHAYGQKIIIPYSDRVIHVDDYSEMENYGKQAILKMYKLYGRKYSVGTFYDTMGERISGNSASYVKKHHNVKHVFTFLLRDNGSYGYALPADQILPACKEALAGLTEIMTAKVRRFRADDFNSSTKFGFDVLLIFVNMIIVFK